MRNGLYGLFSDVKDYLSNGINALVIAILILATNLFYLHNIQIQINNLNQEIKINRDKIHFRYFNLTKSLEEINNVEINTKDGRLIQKVK